MELSRMRLVAWPAPRCPKYISADNEELEIACMAYQGRKS